MIECTRGGSVEAHHVVDVALVDPDGVLVESWGAVDGVVYPRSAIKPIQVLPLFETGVADAIQTADAEIAVACASHSGQHEHVNTVRTWLARCDLGEDDLECGAHLPWHEQSAHALLREGRPPGQIHNMCSGKHTAFLVTAATLGEPTDGYVKRDHPVQRRVSAAIADMLGWDLTKSPWALDGCNIPTVGVPLYALARGAARVADPSSIADSARRSAITRVRAAVAAEPFMLGGDGRVCTAIVRSAGDTVLVKISAEGVFFAALPTLGLGLALKVRDGAFRAADVAIASLLDRLELLDDRQADELSTYLATPLKNWRGFEVGVIRAVLDQDHPRGAQEPSLS